MPKKPTYEELLQKVKTLEEEKSALLKDSAVETRGSGQTGTKKAIAISSAAGSSLGDFINVAELQSIMDDFHFLTGMVTAILDINGVIIESTGWQDICTKFHRVHPETARSCTESDLYLVQNLEPGEFIKYRCKNGLWDVATPLYIGGRHLGNIYTGQFFYDDDVVDEEKFIEQAATYGFNKDAYLEAFHRIPRYSREVIEHLMSFLVKLTSYISNVGYANMTLGMEITERIQGEAALRESEERLQLVMAGSQLGYWDWDIVADKVRRNSHWAEMLGYTLEEVEHTVNQWTDLHHPDDTATAWTSIRDHLEGKTPAHRVEYRMLAKDGHYRWILDQARVVKRDADGKPLRMCGTHTDINEFKRVEKERENLQAQLAQAQKMESVGRLAGGVAHDFNNMLSVIIGNTDMAKDEVDPALPLYENLEEIEKAAEHSADLVSQLLAFARKQTIVPKVVDINATVAGTTNMLRRIIGEDIDLEWLPGLHVWPVKIDPSQIDQILANLCVNARDAIADVGKVTIETANAEFDEAYCTAHHGFLPGGYVLIAVSDNGCGMTAETLNNIFEPFFTTKETGKGTGLGLAMVYGVVKQNNGFINVYSEPGHGTIFKIYLPRYQTKVESLPEQTKNLQIKQGFETILLVEDEPSILKMTAQMLERLGYLVMAAKTPGEAIRIAREYAGEIHLLMTDVVMPEMNGRELAKNILTVRPNLRRLFMSGYTANVIAHHGVLDKGLNFIQKPFSRDQLGSKVRKALDEGTETGVSAT